jgi:hypothetical protein
LSKHIDLLLTDWRSSGRKSVSTDEE